MLKTSLGVVVGILGMVLTAFRRGLGNGFALTILGYSVWALVVGYRLYGVARRTS